MSVKDAIRSTEGEGKPPVPEGKTAQAIQPGHARHGVMTEAPAPADRPAVVPPATVPRKWITAIVVLAILVFIITFALNYVGTGKTGGPNIVEGGGDPVGQLKLTFRSTKFPEAKEAPPVDVELRKTGHRDFWFKNENAKPVKMGLVEVNCKCSGVSVYTLPKGSAEEPGKEAQLEAKATVVELKREDQTTVSVEPEQVGWVRLKWDGERQQASDSGTVLRANLWLNTPTDGLITILETYVRFNEPLKMAKEDLSQLIPSRAATELPFTFVLECWSVTRSELAITAKLSGDRDPAKDLLVVGKPEPLSKKECDSLKEKRNERTIASAYRIPITVRARPETGAPFDAGPFRRRIEISLEDDPQSSQVVDLTGSIKGDLVVQGQSEFRVNFTKFARTKRNRAPRNSTHSSKT